MIKVAFFCPGYESLGIECLSASLRHNGVDTKLFFDPVLFAESNFLEHYHLGRFFSYRRQILHELKEYSPDLICFSVISDNYQWASQWARMIKKAVEARIIFGGIHPTSVPEKVILEEGIDYICVGEGDQALVELAQALADGGDDRCIRNIWKREGTCVFQNEVRPLIQDLDGLPFPDKDIFYEAHPIFRDGYLAMTSRGCPYACSYCCNNVYHKLYAQEHGRVRRRSVDHVLAELEQAKDRYAPRYIAFVDDCFNTQRPWLVHFLKEYTKRISLPFSCYVYPDILDVDLVRMLREAGCFKVQMGVQVISQEKRQRILGRSSAQEKIAQAIDLLRGNNIFVVADAIFGFPDETEAELVQLARFYMEHPPDHCENFWLRYYPGTRITSWALEKGFIDQDEHDNIERGHKNFGLIKRPEHSVDKTYARQIITLLMMYPFLSYKMKQWILNRRRYRIMPVLSSVFMYIFVRLLHHPPFDLNTERTWKRYKHFLIRRLLAR